MAHRNAGDIWAFHDFKADGAADRKRTIANHKLGGNVTGFSKSAVNENEVGEWNKYEITADGGTITLKVNGKELNQATNCDCYKGKIGLQSEGGEIHFRTVCLTPLDR